MHKNRNSGFLRNRHVCKDDKIVKSCFKYWIPASRLRGDRLSGYGICGIYLILIYCHFHAGGNPENGKIRLFAKPWKIAAGNCSHNLVDSGGSGFQPRCRVQQFFHLNTASIHPPNKPPIPLLLHFIAFSSQWSFISIKLVSEWICRLSLFFIHNWQPTTLNIHWAL